MFSETADNWHLEIQDSILEKCPENNDFLSIMVEKESKEVSSQLTYCGYKFLWH